MAPIHTQMRVTQLKIYKNTTQHFFGSSVSLPLTFLTEIWGSNFVRPSTFSCKSCKITYRTAVTGSNTPPHQL